MSINYEILILRNKNQFKFKINLKYVNRTIKYTLYPKIKIKNTSDKTLKKNTNAQQNQFFSALKRF